MLSKLRQELVTVRRGEVRPHPGACSCRRALYLLVPMSSVAGIDTDLRAAPLFLQEALQREVAILRRQNEVSDLVASRLVLVAGAN